MYDLEPLASTTVHPEKLPTFTFNPSNCDSPGYCIMKTLKFRTPNINPAICKPGHRDALEAIRFGFHSVPDLIRAGKPAVFIHPKLQLRGNYDHLAAFVENGKDAMIHQNIERLIQIDPKTVPVKEGLTALQTLLVYLATFITSSGQHEQTYTASLLIILSEWTQILLVSAQTRMPHKQSPWQQWLFGESIRRTVIMSYILSFALSGFYGYCSNWLFMESLPFDGRMGLWMAESPQAWIAAAHARTGEEVGERLNSIHEFAEKLDRSDNFRGDVFLALLAFGHNGGERSHELTPGGTRLD